VLHITQFGDAASSVGDLLASSNFGICDTTRKNTQRKTHKFVVFVWYHVSILWSVRIKCTG